MSQDNRPSLNLRPLLESAATPFSVARYGPRETIFSQGDACDSVLYIEEGRVRLAVTSPGGKEGICGLLEAGAFLGEEVLAGHPARLQTAVAMVATDVLVVAKAKMMTLLHAQPAMSDRFLTHIIARNAHLEADLTDQILNSSEQRLARMLLVLADCDARRPCKCRLPRVSQEIIAEMVGTTRSRVNFFMGKFRKLGFIEQNGGVLLVTPSLAQFNRRTG